MYKNIISFKHINKNFKFVAFNFDSNIKSSIKMNSIVIYCGLKDYYKLNNHNLAYKTDIKKDLVILNRFKFKPIKNSLFYSSYLFPSNSIKSRFLFEFKLNKNEFLLKRFECFIKELNKLNVLNLIQLIMKKKRHISHKLYNCNLLLMGNYNSGYNLSYVGLTGIFLYFKRQNFMRTVFVIKNVFYTYKYRNFKYNLYFAIKNIFYRQKLLSDYCYYLKFNFINNNFKFLIKKFLKEFIKFKYMFRSFSLLLYKVIFIRAVIAKKNYRIFPILYNLYSKKIRFIFKKHFINLIKLYQFYIQFKSFNFNNIYLLLDNVKNVNFLNLYFYKKIYFGRLLKFTNGKIIRTQTKYNLFKTKNLALKYYNLNKLYSKSYIKTLQIKFLLKKQNYKKIINFLTKILFVKIKNKKILMLLVKIYLNYMMHKNYNRNFKRFNSLVNRKYLFKEKYNLNNNFPYTTQIKRLNKYALYHCIKCKILNEKKLKKSKQLRIKKNKKTKKKQIYKLKYINLKFKKYKLIKKYKLKKYKLSYLFEKIIFTKKKFIKEKKIIKEKKFVKNINKKKNIKKFKSLKELNKYKQLIKYKKRKKQKFILEFTNLKEKYFKFRRNIYLKYLITYNKKQHKKQYTFYNSIYKNYFKASKHYLFKKKRNKKQKQKKLKFKC